MARNSKAIICLNTQEVFESAKHVIDKYQINNGSLYQVCLGKRKTAGRDETTGESLQWAYLEDYENGTRKLAPHKQKERKVVCLNTGEVFPSLISAVTAFELNDNTGVSAVCRGYTATYGRHPETKEPLQWAYLEDYESGARKFQLHNTKHRKVICLNTEEIYHSLHDAGTALNIDCSSISHNCLGHVKTAGKHPETGERLRWQYYEEYLKEQAK